MLWSFGNTLPLFLPLALTPGLSAGRYYNEFVQLVHDKWYMFVERYGTESMKQQAEKR